MYDQLNPEPVEKAQAKVDAQREKLARMAHGDPKRVTEERMLTVLVKNATLARTAHLLLADDPNA